MSKIPDNLRRTIAMNIREQRLKRFPGRGGSKRCAEAFGVSPQQWTPWERGHRLPDEYHLMKIADFFGVDVEFLRRNHHQKNNPTVKHSTPEKNKSDGIIWQLKEDYTTITPSGQPLVISLNIVVTEGDIKTRRQLSK